MFPAVRLHLKRLILGAAPLAALACGGDGGTDVVLPALTITTATNGANTDSDGYEVSIDGQEGEPIGANATLTFERLPSGPHTVELSGIAANCAVGENPRTVDVVSGTTATVAFVITCSAELGSVQVVTTTTGTGTDPDGFSLLLDGNDQGVIGLSATRTLGGLTPGSHTIGLAGVAVNCQVSGENFRVVAVTAGGTAEVVFAVTCTAPGPTTATLEVVATTTGAGTDPDGFALLLDGAEQGAIGVSATRSLAGLATGPHTIGLTGLAANCEVSGENPRSVTLPAGETVQVVFAVACTAAGPTTGTLVIAAVTTGAAQDADGYLFSVDGGAGRPIGTNASVRLANISAAQHTVELQGIAANCRVAGDNPLGVAVSSGETARISFTVTCVATVGSLRVTVSGLPASANAAVTVSGPNNFSSPVTATRTLTGLAPGSYAVSAGNVVTGGTTYTPSVSRPTVDVAAGATAEVSVSYTGAAPITLNLRIDGLYLTQSTQRYVSDVPLVADRPGYLRVFVVANESNTARPAVRVRLSSPGAADRILTIPAPSGQTPVRVQEGTLGSSWNIGIDGSLIRPGLAIAAEVDFDNTIKESNEGDNLFPTSGNKTLSVQSVPVAKIRFVSVQQGSGTPGNISNTAQILELARRIHPLNGVDVDTRATVFPTSVQLEAGGAGWDQLVSDIDGLRVAEGSDRTYYGLVKLNYAGGKVGNAFVGIPSAIGTDNPADVARVVAHELGHTWGRYHSPCGNPGGLDPTEGYPYSGGVIGVYGFDVKAEALKPRSTPDIMGYCTGPWISDRTYERVMDFRQSSAAATAALAPAQSSVLVWGRVVDGRPVLEPAFQIVTRPSLPKRPGPYSVSALASDGSRLFSLSFDMATVEDNQPGKGHFAFAVPLDQATASRLAHLTLEGPTGRASSSLPPAQLRTDPSSETIVARREGENVSLHWNAAAHPMIMVRDPDTGEVLSFGRGGTVTVRTGKGELVVDVSDGVRSQRLRLAISRS